MANSEMYVAYLQNGTAIVNRYTPSGHSQPTLVASNLQISTADTNVASDGSFKISFIRNKIKSNDTVSANLQDGASLSVVWAYGATTPVSATTFTVHSVKGAASLVMDPPGATVQSTPSTGTPGSLAPSGKSEKPPSSGASSLVVGIFSLLVLLL